jgi:glutathione S-transferase
MFADQITDLTNEFVKAIFEKDENRKKDIQDRLGSEVIPNNLKIFESRLGKNNSGYLIGKSLTWTDLYLVSVLDWLGENKQPTLEHFPHLKAFDQQIRAIPSIAQWISKRPKTAM